MRLIDKDALLKLLDETINDFKVKDESDQAFLEGVVATRRIIRYTEEVNDAVQM